LAIERDTRKASAADNGHLAPFRRVLELPETRVSEMGINLLDVHQSGK
jgi:hypothetical protein